MFFFLYQDDEVAGSTATNAYITAAAHAELHTVLHSCGYVYSYGFLAIDAALTFTSSTFARNGRALTFTGMTWRHGLHLPHKGIVNPAYLAATATGLTSSHRIAVFGAALSASGTANVFFYLDFFGNAIGDFGIVEF